MGKLDKIAIISDIHGNLPALESVLADITDRKIEKIFCLGDMTGKGPFSINIIRQPYDIELAVAQATKSGVPQLENHIVELRTAVYRGLQ